MPGISGLALYLPACRVQLSDWCEWNNQPWNKINKVIGRSFRMRGPDESIYTMAANAAWRLLQAYQIDPGDVGSLALGTESSSDNSAGSVIVRGLLDDALAANGRPPLARDCEVPEYKHACLGGMYALKGALRYLSADGANRQAIVVCADIAEYERGSTGEPTQGAGAVAMLLEAEPKLVSVDLAGTGSSSAYRLADFRKPFARYRGQAERVDGQMQDLPVFNGHYSTSCYVDATCRAIEALLDKPGVDGATADARLDSLDAVFMHRPYQRMPETGWGMARLAALARDSEGRAQLQSMAADAGLDGASVLAELTTSPDLRDRLCNGDGAQDVYGTANQLLRHLRRGPVWQRWVDEQLALGSAYMRDMGNLYTAALPAWLAAGFVQALAEGLEPAGRDWLALGYGSGDAAEAWPMRVVAGWQAAASAINFEAALAAAVDLTRQQYVALHDGHATELPAAHSDGFVVDCIGDGRRTDFDDTGIEYYRMNAHDAGATGSS